MPNLRKTTGVAHHPCKTEALKKNDELTFVVLPSRAGMLRFERFGRKRVRKRQLLPASTSIRIRPGGGKDVQMPPSDDQTQVLDASTVVLTTKRPSIGPRERAKNIIFALIETKISLQLWTSSCISTGRDVQNRPLTANWKFLFTFDATSVQVFSSTFKLT